MIEISNTNNGNEKKKLSGIASGLVTIAFISQLGMTIITPIILGALAGHWLDVKMGTGIIFFLILFCLGIAGGIYGAYKLIKTIEKKKE
ncbi:MAG: AtpZ/AtpI family protein [Eubacteriales bacterium]|nr:AtpZ/AtpI family protein [Eubacteriales bacterium]